MAIIEDRGLQEGQSRYKELEAGTSLTSATDNSDAGVAGHRTRSRVEREAESSQSGRGSEGLLIHSKDLKLILSVWKVDFMYNVLNLPTSLHLCLSQCKFVPFPIKKLGLLGSSLILGWFS